MVILQIEKQDLAGLIEEAVNKALTESLKQLQVGKHEEEEKLMTVKEAAEFLKCTVATIYDNVSKGNIPHMKRSKRLFFLESELREYLKAGRRKTNRQILEEAQSYIQAK